VDKKKRQATVKGRKQQVEAQTAAPAAKTEVKEAMGALPKMPRMPSAGRKPRNRPVRDCACGCGTMTKATWAPGHDARAKGWAIRIERDICKLSDVPAAEQQGAKFMLKVRKETAAAGGTTKSDLKVVKGGKEPAPAPEVAATGTEN
jgi:hypothetical protein